MRRIRKVLPLIAALLGGLGGTQAAPAGQVESKAAAQQQDALVAKVLPLTEANYIALSDYILPRPDELRWQQIPWRATWAEAVAAAKKENKPICVWAMNGHPLGNC